MTDNRKQTVVDNSSSAALIGDMITSMKTGNFSPLQLSIGLFIHDDKEINELYKYGVCASYGEVRRFKVSAALASEKLTLNKNLMSK